jgi:hypothetical protein
MCQKNIFIRFFSTRRLMVVARARTNATSGIQPSIFDMSDYCLIEKFPACALTPEHFLLNERLMS